MSEYQLIENIIPEDQVIPKNSILSQSLLQNEHTRVILFTFAPDQELSEHTASKPAMLHFLEGEAEVTLGDVSFQTGAGAFIYMQPHLPHSIYAKTAVKMLLIMIEQGK